MVAVIDWNKEPTVAECVDKLLDAIRRRDRAMTEIAYWQRKLREARDNGKEGSGGTREERTNN